MKETGKDTTSRNATIELTPEEARKKRRYLLELARQEAEKTGVTADPDDHADSVATFILPGD